MHPVEQFWAELAALDDQFYPPGVVPIREHIRGTAFFPGGSGLYIDDPDAPLPPFPVGGTMFVGHNFDAELPYLKRLQSGKAHGDRRWPMRTWLNLYRLLDMAAIDVHACFFTNIYVGLIAGEKPMGRFPGAKDRAFTDWCADFLHNQVRAMRPRVVVLLGGDARRFFGLPDRDVGTTTIAGCDVRYVCLAHPSMHPANVRARGGVEGEAARLVEAVKPPRLRLGSPYPNREASETQQITE